jgi:hypothetical protein
MQNVRDSVNTELISPQIIHENYDYFANIACGLIEIRTRYFSNEYRTHWLWTDVSVTLFSVYR